MADSNVFQWFVGAGQIDGVRPLSKSSIERFEKLIPAEEIMELEDKLTIKIPSIHPHFARTAAARKVEAKKCRLPKRPPLQAETGFSEKNAKKYEITCFQRLANLRANAKSLAPEDVAELREILRDSPAADLPSLPVPRTHAQTGKIYAQYGMVYFFLHALIALVEVLIACLLRGRRTGRQAGLTRRGAWGLERVK